MTTNSLFNVIVSLDFLRILRSNKMLREKIKLTAIVGFLMILLNCCSHSQIYRTADEVGRVVRVIRKGVESSPPNDSTVVQYRK